MRRRRPDFRCRPGCPDVIRHFAKYAKVSGDEGEARPSATWIRCHRRPYLVHYQLILTTNPIVTIRNNKCTHSFKKKSIIKCRLIAGGGGLSSSATTTPRRQMLMPLSDVDTQRNSTSHRRSLMVNIHSERSPPNAVGASGKRRQQYGATRAMSLSVGRTSYDSSHRMQQRRSVEGSSNNKKSPNSLSPGSPPWAQYVIIICFMVYSFSTLQMYPGMFVVSSRHLQATIISQ